MSVWRAIRTYMVHDDPLVAAGNLIALVIAWNQPFYPPYLYWLVSENVSTSFYTFLSTPFFVAVPAVARRHSLAGRALLPLTGIANTAFSVKLFGEASGVELFLAPCVMLAAMLFRRDERLVMLALVGLAFVVFAGLHGNYGAPLHLYTTDEYAHFLRLNAFSVGTLMAFMGLTFANALAQIESRKVTVGVAPASADGLGDRVGDQIAERRSNRG